MLRSNLFVLLAIVPAIALTLFLGWMLITQEIDKSESLAAGDDSTTVAKVPIPPADMILETSSAEKEQIEPSNDLREEPRPKEGARIFGQFLLPDGTPAEGVELELSGWQSNDEAVCKYGLPRNWRDLNTKTDAQGEFEFRFDPPQAYQFAMKTHFEGYAEVGWRWFGLLPDEEKDLGTITLSQSGTILVTLKDRHGKVVKSGWTIYASRNNSYIHAKIDPDTGIATVVNVPPGPTQLQAQSKVSGWIDGPKVDLLAGQVLEAEINYNGPDNSRRIIIGLDTEPGQVARLIDPNTIMISSDGLRWKPAKRCQNSSRKYSFDDLAPGSYMVKVENESFEPWIRNNIEPGRSITAKMRGNAALKVNVLDDATQKPLEYFGIGIRYVGYSTNIQFDVFRRPEFLKEEGLYTPITAAVKCRLVVTAKGYSKLEVPLGELSPYETRFVEARMKRSAEIRGQVFRSDGKTPVEGANVHLQHVGESVRDSIWLFGDDENTLTVTDSSGCFRITSLPACTRSLHVAMNPWIIASITELTLSAGEVQDDLRILLPPASFLQGCIKGKSGFSFEGMQLFLKPSAIPNVKSPQYCKTIKLELADNGTFRSDFLPPGKATLELWGPLTRSNVTSTLELAELTLKPGNNEVEEIELGDRIPGSIRVHVLRDGNPSAGNMVRASKDRPQGQASTDSQGIAVISHLFPGKWMVAVQHNQYSGWYYVHPTPITVESDKETECTVIIRLFEGKIRIVNPETEEPWVQHEIWLTYPDSHVVRLKTDTNGDLSLVLPEGTYSLSAATYGERELYKDTMTWTPTGSAVDTFRLKAE